MDQVILEFDIDLNASLAVGDIIYYLTEADDIVKIGAVVGISRPQRTIVAEISPDTIRPSTSDFVFFSKDGEINITGLTGYFATVNMRLSGRDKKELYAVNAEVFKSS